MPTVWFALRKSLNCTAETDDVHDPRRYESEQQQQQRIVISRKGSRCSCGCSKSIANLRDVIHSSSKRISGRVPSVAATSCSPRSIGSSDFFNPVLTHELLANASRSEFGFQITSRPAKAGLRHRLSFENCHFSLAESANDNTASACLSNSSTPRFSNERSGEVLQNVACAKCGERISKNTTLEYHHLTKHAVSLLVEGDSSRNIVEIIFRSSWLKSENPGATIDRILKVHNLQKVLARFEEFRETVKAKASRLAKKHPRCVADGNELLRFYGTTVMCSLGVGMSGGLCKLDGCNVCRIIRRGFSMKDVGTKGIHTCSTSARALQNVSASDQPQDDFMVPTQKALLVCRVIAGRVHRPLENLQHVSAPLAFDSVAGKPSPFSAIEDLFVLNPMALLPCFVIVCKSF